MVWSEIWEKHARVSFSKTIAVVDVKSEPLYWCLEDGVDYNFNPTVFTLVGIGRNLAKIHVLDIDNWITF
jgi:hypothetical protein